LKASEPASRIAAIAMKVSLRIDSLPVVRFAGGLETRQFRLRRRKKSSKKLTAYPLKSGTNHI
jgi:hypothetical protein